jgi:ABC-type multidrug transport system fused ATPase/permease subunit
MVSSQDMAKWEAARKNLKKGLWKSLLKFWLLTLLILVTSIGSIAALGYAMDRGKMIPMMMHYSFLSLTSGLPDAVNGTEVTDLKAYREAVRENFKLPEVTVWPYYLGFGFANTCVVLTVVVHFIPISKTSQIYEPGTVPPNRRRRRAAVHRRWDCDGCCYGCYWNPCDFMYCHGCSCESCGGLGPCDLSCCAECSSEAGFSGIAISLIVVVVVVIVALAAICGLFYLFFMGLAYTFVLQNQYMNKLLDLERSRTEAVCVRDLERMDDARPASSFRPHSSERDVSAQEMV